MYLKFIILLIIMVKILSSNGNKTENANTTNSILVINFLLIINKNKKINFFIYIIL